LNKAFKVVKLFLKHPVLFNRSQPRRMRWEEHVAEKGKKERLQVISGKARRKESTVKTNM
jgi:hypothetical protein